MIHLDRAEVEHWPLASAFKISRGIKTKATTVVVELSALDAFGGNVAGRGEATPYPHYGETPDECVAMIRAAFSSGIAGHHLFSKTSVLPEPTAFAGTLPALDAARSWLLDNLSPGAARNAIDCALWDLAAKAHRKPVWKLAALSDVVPVVTCYTISLDTPEVMAGAARDVGHLPLLKLKLGGTGDDIRMRAVRAARPDARLVVDANEGWSPDNVVALLKVAMEVDVELIEQPLPAASDSILEHLSPGVPICADESAEPGIDCADLCGRYDAINIKLDKAGGLTGALELLKQAKAHNLKIMVGSMVATSLAMAPAMLLTGSADWVDLDSPLLLAQDRIEGMVIDQGMISPPSSELWG